MPAPYVLRLAPVVGIDSSTTITPNEQLVLTLTPVIKGDKGMAGDPTALVGISGIVINQTNKTIAIDPSVVATQTDLANTLGTKVDKITGKGLSTEDYSTAEKTKLSGIASGATANQTDTYLLSRTNHTGTQAASTITGLATVATSNDYNDLVNKPSGGSSLSFDGSRWMFNDLIAQGLVGGFQTAIIRSGSLLTSNYVGGYGCVVIKSTTTANSGGLVTSSSVMAGGSAHTLGLTRSIFQLPSAVAARVVRAGFFSHNDAPAETSGTWLEISGDTAVAKSSSNSFGSQRGSAVLPLNVWLVCDVEYPTSKSARVVIFNLLDNTKYLDETFTDTNYFPNQDVLVGIKAWHSGASTAQNLVGVDYVGTGIKRPSFIVTPA